MTDAAFHPPPNPEEHAAFYRALCRRLLRGLPDERLRELTPASLAGLYADQHEYPDAVDSDSARREADRVLREIRDHRDIAQPDSPSSGFEPASENATGEPNSDDSTDSSDSSDLSSDGNGSSDSDDADDDGTDIDVDEFVEEFTDTRRRK